VAYGRAFGAEELPDIVTAVGVSEGAGEDRPVRSLPNVVVVEPTVPRVPVDGVVLVTGLPIQAGLDGFTRIVALDHLVVGCIPGAMTRLQHVEVQPWLFMEELGGGRSPHRVIGNRVVAAVAPPNPSSDCAPDGIVSFVLAGPVAAEDPDHLLVLIPFTQKTRHMLMRSLD